jgi:hypothetical protein
MAIQRGEGPTVYVRYMIDLARTARSLVLWSGIFIMKGRNNMLVKRVTNILNMKRSTLEGRFTMKTRTLVSIVILVLTVLIIIGSCATSKKAYVAKEDEELYGTWVNPEYDNTSAGEPGRMIIKNGTYEIYGLSNITRWLIQGEYTITDKWTDSDGNVWYKYMVTKLWYQTGVTRTDPLYGLAKISNSGRTLERVYSGIDYPRELSQVILEYTYQIHYRQE